MKSIVIDGTGLIRSGVVAKLLAQGGCTCL
jgi:uncharacterized protein YbjT (DUF2867 family)